MKFSWMAMSLVVSLGALGCGGEKSPSEKCIDLFSTICQRIVDCVPEASGMYDACVKEIKDTALCANVKKVSASFNDCLHEVDSQSCPVLFPDSENPQDIQTPVVCEQVLEAASFDDSLASAPAPLSGVLDAMAAMRGPVTADTTRDDPSR